MAPMIFRPPTLAEVVQRAAEVSGCSVEALLVPGVLAPLERALDVDVTRAAPVHVLAADMCAGLLAGVLEEAPRIVESVLRETLERSDATWTLAGLATVLHLQAWQRRPGPPKALADWMALHITASEEPRKPDWSKVLDDHRDEVFQPVWTRHDPGGRGEPAVLLSGPAAHLLEGSVPLIELAHVQVLRGMDAAVAHQRRRVALRLLHPCMLAEGEQRTHAQWMTLIEDLVPREADGIILSDIAHRAPGFGAAVEVMMHASTSGPRLVLMDSSCRGHSHLEYAMVERFGARLETFDDPKEIPWLVAAWIDDVYEELLATRRRRINRRLLYEAELGALRARVARVSPEILRSALRRSFMSAEQLGRNLSSVEAWQAIPSGQLRELVRELAGGGPVPPVRWPDESRVNLAELRRAAKLKGWSAREEAQLCDSVRRELMLAGAEHRLPALTADDWIAAHGRLLGPSR
jgi:hypothetical protein